MSTVPTMMAGGDWIFEPLLIVDVLTAQGRDRERALSQAECCSELPIAVDVPTEFVGNVRCLIDHRPPVHDVDESAR